MSCLEISNSYAAQFELFRPSAYVLCLSMCVGCLSGSGSKASRLCMDKVATAAAIAHVCDTACSNICKFAL